MLIVQRLGWTLLHFFWQGTSIVIAYVLLRWLLGRSYALACAALIAMVAAPVLTFIAIADSPARLWTVSASEWRWLMNGVVAVWLMGVIVSSIRLFGAWRCTARLKSTAHPAPAEWQRALEDIAARLGVARPARLLVSSLVDVPTVIGWLKPAILVPIKAFAGLPAGHLTALLSHEMAHIGGTIT